MAFALRDVGLDCFTLVFRGEDIGSVFSTDDGDALPWIAALHDGRFRMGSTPAPFRTDSHRFGSFEDLQDWLGLSGGAPQESVA
ncbi:MAG TPA: hypothetical protein VHG30_15070 [Microvirga sp.]|jgi:hypothetical protein|nr:hypothetical protein [Microvirga sp.]